MKRPGVGLSVIIIKEDKVLLGKRKGSHGEGTYAFPGGHLENNEGFLDCLSREIKEEVGDVKIQFIDKFPSAVTNDIFNEDKHYVTLFIRAKYISGEPQVLEPEKCEKWEWYSWDNLPSPLFLPIKNLIKQNYNIFAK